MPRLFARLPMLLPKKPNGYLRTMLAACAAALVLQNASPAIAAEPQYLQVRMSSQVVTQFWGQDVKIEAHVLLPDSYYKAPATRYPVLYWIQGFDGYGNPGFEETLG